MTAPDQHDPLTAPLTGLPEATATPVPVEVHPAQDPLDSLLADYTRKVDEQRGKRRVTFEVDENRERGLLPLALTLRAMNQDAILRCTRGRDREEGQAAVVAAATVAVHVEVDGQWVTIGEAPQDPPGSAWTESLARRFGKTWVSPHHLVREVFPDDIALASFSDDYGRWVGLGRETSREVAVGEGSASST